MQQNARLIIPLWGKTYADKLTSMTLPALLAPGNLPALCAMFNVEVVIVTETQLFDLIRSSRSCERLERLCPVTFIEIDDLMSDLPGDYGVVLTKALYRGFLNLGEKVTQTFLLFLNADFIIADGSYRRLGELMLAGHRVIHSPSFRAVLEQVWPKLEARVDPETGVLAVPQRELVKLALDHKHPTVNARTVNQQLYHQHWMDQFYWHVDENTLIGYQWPVALVAIRPERVVKEPTCVWDYGYVPEAAPTLERYFIQDSDQFFMLEPQRKVTGREMIRVGWLTPDEVAKLLSRYTTKEQRECGQQLLIFHASDLPPDLDAAVGESRRYMKEVIRRLSLQPQPHVHHPILDPWFADAMRRIGNGRARRVLAPDDLEVPGRGGRDISDPDKEANAQGPTALHQVMLGLATFLRRACPRWVDVALFRTVTALQEKMFGIAPFLRRTHPLWIDTVDVATHLASWRCSGRDRILWLSSKYSFFRSWMGRQPEPPELFLKSPAPFFAEGLLYDACLCELGLSDVVEVPTLYNNIRQLVRDGGEILIYVHIHALIESRPLCATALELTTENFFPARDVSSVRFRGNSTTDVIRRIFFQGTIHLTDWPALRIIMASLTVLILAPFAFLANWHAGRRDPQKFTRGWTSAILHFVVKKDTQARPAREIGKIAQIGQAPEGKAHHSSARRATVA